MLINIKWDNKKESGFFKINENYTITILKAIIEAFSGFYNCDGINYQLEYKNQN